MLKLGYRALAVDVAGAYIVQDLEELESSPLAALEQYLADSTSTRSNSCKPINSAGDPATTRPSGPPGDTTLQKIDQRHADVRPSFLLAFLTRFDTAFAQEDLFRLASLRYTSETWGQEVYLADWLKKFLTTVDDNNKKDLDSFRYRKAIQPLIR